MKRKSLKFMACATVMALMLSVTACGGSDDGANNDTVNVEEDATEPQEEVNEEPQGEENAEPEAEENAEPEVEDTAKDEAKDDVEEANAGAEGYFETLEEAFAEPAVKAAMDEQLGAMDMDGMEVSYEVTGNDFIVTYKVLETTIDDPDDFAVQMEPVMDQLETLFSAVAEMFDEGIGQEGATSVIVRYLDANDTLLIERSYKAD